MVLVVEAEVIPKIYFLVKVLRSVPPETKINHRGKLSFRHVLRYIRKHDPALYSTLYTVYDCDSEECLSRSMANILLWVVVRGNENIFLNGKLDRVGDLSDRELRRVEEALREYGFIRL